MRLNLFLIIIILLVPLTAVGTYFGYIGYKVDYVKTIEAHIIVADMHGINVNNEKVYLGAVYPGGSAYRNFTVNNSDDIRREIKIEIKGDMEDWAFVSPKRFHLDPGGSQQVRYRATAPGDAVYGNHTAKILVYFMKE